MAEKILTPVTSKHIDSKYALDVNRWILSVLGIWQFAVNSSYSSQVKAFFQIFICLFLTLFGVIPGILLIFIVLKDVTAQLKAIGCFNFCIMGMIKYVYLINSIKDIGICVKLVNADWNRIKDVNDRAIMINYAKFGRNISLVCAIFMYATCLFYASILPKISGTFKDPDDLTKRSFAIPNHFFYFDQYESPAYEIVFSIHCCCCFVFTSIFNATCNLLTVLITHACGQLEIVMEWLKNLHTLQDDDDFIVAYSNIIEQHVRTLRFITKIENLFQKICFFEILGCTLLICFIGYYILLDWSQKDTGGITTYLTLLISFTYNIFLYCYACELLTEKCQLVSESTYLSQWYTLPKKYSRGFVLTIAVSQNSNYMKAGKLIPLSINSFGTVMRTSAAYLNFLRTFMK